MPWKWPSSARGPRGPASPSRSLCPAPVDRAGRSRTGNDRQEHTGLKQVSPPAAPAGPNESTENDMSIPKTTEKFTDVGNARRLVARHGQDIRYVPAWGCWLVWDGKRLRRDDIGELMIRAKET